ncbi:XRE family transcriptional regulator [Sphingobacterium sp. MYb382]|uniref:XRE family transcriptional regulator n=1 Tax=Sphingobacterium sp. MYb382 TaxID=2745278 RepID=UPI0030B405C2
MKIVFMPHTATPNPKTHQGRNVKRFREMLGIKQESLAYDLGDEWNEKKILLLEQKEIVETTVLQQIANVLKFPLAAIQNFNEEQPVNIIANTFDNGSIAYQRNENCTFNTDLIEKWMEAIEENKRLQAELAKVKDEQIKLLQQLLAKKHM